MESEVCGSEECYLYHISGKILFKSKDLKEIEKEAKKYPSGDVRAGPKLTSGICVDWDSLNEHQWKRPIFED